MALTINTNVASLLAQNNLSSSQSALATSIQRLSSGMRINSAADDAAGLAIIQRMTAQINGNTQAGQNANDAINIAQTAGSGLSQITNDLQRIRQLAVQSANGTNSSSDRAALQTEVTQLVSEVDRIAQNTSFNGVNLLDGTFNNQQFQVGANAGQTITIGAITSSRAATLGQSYSSTVTSTGAATAITAAGQFTVTDAAGSAIDVYQGSSVAADAQLVANAINARGIAGVSATAVSTTVTAAAAAATAAHAGKMTINGVNTATVTATGVAATDLAAAISAANLISAATGVTASNVGGALKLTAVDCRNITFA